MSEPTEPSPTAITASEFMPVRKRHEEIAQHAAKHLIPSLIEAGIIAEFAKQRAADLAAQFVVSATTDHLKRNAAYPFSSSILGCLNVDHPERQLTSKDGAPAGTGRFLEASAALEQKFGEFQQAFNAYINQHYPDAVTQLGSIAYTKGRSQGAA